MWALPQWDFVLCSSASSSQTRICDNHVQFPSTCTIFLDFKLFHCVVQFELYASPVQLMRQLAKTLYCGSGWLYMTSKPISWERWFVDCSCIVSVAGPSFTRCWPGAAVSTVWRRVSRIHATCVAVSGTKENWWVKLLYDRYKFMWFLPNHVTCSSKWLVTLL